MGPADWCPVHRRPLDDTGGCPACEDGVPSAEDVRDWQTDIAYEEEDR